MEVTTIFFIVIMVVIVGLSLIQFAVVSLDCFVTRKMIQRQALISAVITTVAIAFITATAII